MPKKRRCTAKQNKALTAFIAANHDKLYAIAYRYARNPDDARDLLQETYLRVIERYPDFDGRNIHGWLHTILRNIWISLVRKEQTHARLSSYIRADDIQPDNLELSVVLRDIVEIMQQLPMPQRKTISKVTMGMSYSAIAKKTKMPIGSVKGNIHRARQALAVAF